MTQAVAEIKIRRLEEEVATLWQIVDDERFWDLSIIKEIQRRSKSAHRDYAKKRLKAADDVFASVK